MTALYELAAEVRETFAALEALDLDEQTIADTMEGVVAPFEDKVVAVAKYIRNQEILAAAIKEQQAALAARLKSTQNRIESLQGYLLTHMTSVGCQKVVRPEIEVALHKKAPVLVVDDSSTVPGDFWRLPPPPPPPEPVLDRKLMLDALKAGQPVPGAHMEAGFRVSIK